MLKYLKVNVPRETKDLYEETYETLMQKIKDDINRWRDITWSWVGRINIVKMTIPLNAIYRFNDIPIKLPINNDIFHRTRTKNFTIQMEAQNTLNNQSSLEKEEGSWKNEPF